jgi:ketosteroid isomerase-like protein
MSDANRQLIQRFYDALARRDAETMAACYAADATFADPVFELSGAECGDMWRMLCARGKDLEVEAFDIAADDSAGSAHWIAHYTFSGTGRAVVNRISARFRFAQGLIREHVDRFDLWRWSAQALGPVGLLLGWTPLVRSKIRRQAAEGLRRFRAERPSAA